MICPVNIIGVGAYFPQRVKTNEAFDGAAVGVGARWFEALGVQARRVAGEDETIIDLAYEAARRAIEAAGVDPQQIDRIIGVSATPDPQRVAPSGFAELQRRLGIDECATFSLIDTCAGALMATELATQAIQLGIAKVVLVVAAEAFSKVFDGGSESGFKFGVGMGDGAGAIILSGDPAQPNGFMGAHLQTHTVFSSGLGVRVAEGGGRFTFGLGAAPPMLNGAPLDPREAAREIKAYTSATIPSAIEALFKKINITNDDIDFYFLHQPNRAFIDEWKRRAQIPDHKAIDTLSKYGNLSTVSVLANLNEAYQNNLLKYNDLIVFASIGEGVNVCAMAWRWHLNLQ